MRYDPDLELLLHLDGTTGDRPEDLLVDGRPINADELERLAALPTERLDELSPVVRCLDIMLSAAAAEMRRCWDEVDAIEARVVSVEHPTLVDAIAAGRVPADVRERLEVLMARLDELGVSPFATDGDEIDG